MTAPELAELPAAIGHGARSGAAEGPVDGRLAVATVAALTVLGFALRVVVAHQSIFADELSTYWISATHGLGGVLSLMYGTGRIVHAEISPPLYFVLAWLATRLGDTPELLRLPSLVAGTASLPVIYLIGVRTIGRRPALPATAVSALSPFMIYYSADARAYAVMIFALLVSTLSMLLAVDSGRTRWWVLYAVSACAAFYAHYTAVFVLGLQFLWVVWQRPEARRPILLAGMAAAAGTLPWAPGLINDLHSPTVAILKALSPFTATDIRIDITHWLIGYPETFAGGLAELPGTVALVLLAAAASVAAAGGVLARRSGAWRAPPAGADRRWLLIAALAVATPVAELVLGALGDSVFSVRDLGASWPYLAMSGAAVVTILPGRPAALAAVLAVAGFALAADRMLGSAFRRPAYQDAAAYLSRTARPRDVVVDETGALSPGPLTGLDVALHRRLRIFRAEAPAERSHPYGFTDPIIPLQQAVLAAVAAAGGHRVFLVTNAFFTDVAGLARRINPAPTQFPARYRLVAERGYVGLGGTVVAVYADRATGQR
jgi:4-amino-4-deoxy-L-arabinose transferase-like glycosyltransferase